MEPFDLSPDSIASLWDKLDCETAGELGRVTASIQRAAAQGRHPGSHSVLAWALWHLKERSRANSGAFKPDDLIAIKFVFLLRALLQQVRAYPASLMRGLINEFYHTFGVAHAAQYLEEAGHRVEIVPAEATPERCPDLVLIVPDGRRAAVEVKAPRALQWPFAAPKGEGTLQKLLDRQLRDARDQVDAELGGVVVLFASSMGDEDHVQMEAALRELAHRRKISRRIAAVIGFCHMPQIQVRLERPGVLDVRFLKQTILVGNPKYDGLLRISAG